MKASAAATYERSRRLANVAIFAVDLQVRRLTDSGFEDGEFVSRRWSDFDFLVVAITRLRRAAGIAAEIPEIKPQISDAIAEFGKALPSLKRFRDVAEHVDDYALNRGRHAVARQQLEVSCISGDGPTLEWLGHQLNASEALRASRRLFRAI
jgi:hypothetical protein